jgi:hypothetical protein
MINLFDWDGTKYLGDILDKFISFLPNVLSAIAIFVIGIIIARFIEKIIRKLLVKIKADKLTEGLQKIEFIDKMNINVKLSNIIAKFVYYFLVLIFLVVSTDILGIPIVSNMIVDVFNFIPNLLIALLLLIIGLLLANWLKNLVLTVAKSLNLPSASLLSNLVFYFILINVLISAMVQAKINIEFFSTNISLIIGGVVFAFALAYGLASKNIMSNIISSFYYKNKYKIGDYIKIGENEGEVCEKDNFHIVLCNKKNKIYIPLSKLNDNELIIINKS